MARKATTVTTVTGKMVKTGRKIQKRRLSAHTPGLGKGFQGVKSRKVMVDETVRKVQKNTQRSEGVPNPRTASRRKGTVAKVNRRSSSSPIVKSPTGSFELRGRQKRDLFGRFS